MSSMKEVAKLAGVSLSTVSRVINGTMFVTEETRRKVEEAIRIVNYKPNLLAQSLRLQSTKNIGLLVPEIAHSSFKMIVKYIEESASRRGLNLLLFNTNNDYKKESVAIDMLLRQKINGIIFSRVSDESQVINIRETTDTPVVVIDRALLNEKIPNVIIDNYLAGKMAAEHLLKCGCRHIACITGSFRIGLCRERFQGFVDTLIKEGSVFNEQLRYEGDFNFDTGAAAAQYFLDSGYTVDGIWGQNDLIAAGAISTLLRAGVRIPKDIAVMGMDDVQFARMYYPAITTIAQPYKEICENALDCIDRISGGESLSDYRVVLEPSLVIRESAPHPIKSLSRIETADEEKI